MGRKYIKLKWWEIIIWLTSVIDLYYNYPTFANQGYRRAINQSLMYRGNPQLKLAFIEIFWYNISKLGCRLIKILKQNHEITGNGWTQTIRKTKKPRAKRINPG